MPGRGRARSGERSVFGTRFSGSVLRIADPEEETRARTTARDRTNSENVVLDA